MISPKLRRTPPSLLMGTSLLLMALWWGCSAPLRLGGGSPASPAAGLAIRTQDGSAVTFARESWRLTFSGIEGEASITPSAGVSYLRDTTISYFQVAAVDSRDEDPWTQLLLTILGVIIVIGLAGVILYAAFRATER